MADIYINAGSLRHQVQIQSQGTTQGATGGQVGTGWTTLRTARAMIQAVGSKEQFQAEQFSAQVTHTITLRYSPSPAIAPGMQAVYVEPNGTVHTYQIQAVDNVLQRNVKLVLMCLEINGGQ